MPVRTPALVTLLMLLVLAAVTAAGEPVPTGSQLDPARVGWSEIRMSGSKLFLSAEARLTLRTVPGPGVTPDLLQVPASFNALTPGADVLELVYEARGVGRASRITLLMDPRSGSALQRNQVDQQGRLRHRIYRFGADGAYHRTWWPADKAEESLQPARWTKVEEGLRAYPEDPGTSPVLESTGLLYALAAASLDRPGDSLEVLVFRRRDTQRVQVDVLEPREISVRYDELWPRGTVERAGRVTPIRLSIKGQPSPGADPDDDLEILGLRGNLELLLDPATRAPLQLSGDVKILGKVTLRLAAVRPR